jgi:membrane protein YdbS with pleckstrin-like domain
MPLQHVDMATVTVWRWESTLVALVAALVSALPLAPMSQIAAAVVVLAIAVLGLIAAWYWPAARYRHLRYGVDEFGLLIQEGVWWRAQIALPRVRIQHSDVSQGPLQRRYGLATLKLYTAGSRYTKVELEGLRHDEAIALRDALLSRAHASA